MGAPEPESKGSGLLSWVKVVHDRVDAARWQRFVTALPPESRALIERPPLPVTWLPLRFVQPIWQSATDLLFDGDLEKVAEVGRLQIRADLSTIYRVFIRVASPRYVAQRATALYGTYFRANGLMSVVAEGEHRTDVRVAGVALPTPAFYASLRGSVAGAIELTGVHDVRAEIVEGGGASPNALFTVTWR
jgi:hypothetical protein